MVFFNNSYFLGSALVALLLVAACAYHLNQVTKLAEFIRDSCPQLQGKLRAANRLGLDGQIYYLGRQAGRRLDGILFFNAYAEDFPNDPEFRRLLRASRWSAIICIIGFFALVVLLGNWNVPLDFASKP